MKKTILTVALSLSMVVVSPPNSYASTGAAMAAGGAAAQSVLGAGASSAYSSQNFSRCSWHNFMACIQGVMGIMQLIQMLKGAGNARAAALTLGNGLTDLSFDPVEAGLCFDPTCGPDAIDKALVGFKDAFKTGEGYEAAEAAMLKKAEAQLDAMKKKGYKIDTKAGTVTAPNGKSFNMANFKGKMSPKLEKLMASKMEGIKKVFGGGGRGVASTGKKGGVIFQDEYVGGGQGLYGAKAKKKKRDNSKFLAGLSDKDAGKGGIGFAGDNIFGMIKRRYTKKMKAKEFLSK